MKKKLLLIASMVIFVLCIFVMTVGAQDVSSVDPQFGTVESIGGAGAASTERVKLACGDHFHTYPSSYIVTQNTSLTFDFTLVSKNGCGVTYTKDNVVAFEMPESVTTMPGAMFNGSKSIKYFRISKSFTGFGGNNTFDGSTLEWFDFNENTIIKEIKQSTFCGCKSLKGICFPDQMTTMGVYCLANCPNLGPVYLPSSLTTFSGDKAWPTFAPPGGNDGAGREFNKNMYFVNEKFTDPAKAEKPTVYYVPSGVSSMWNCGFRGMSNINDVIVFPTATTNIDTGYDLCFTNMGTSADKEKTIIFLGNVTKLRLYESQVNVNLVFANENDTGIDSFTLNTLADNSVPAKPGKMYFCASGAVYNCNKTESDSEMRHFADERKATIKDPATCDKNATYDTYCYCGAYIGVKENEGTALGHTHSVFVDLVYVDYSKNGYYSYQCERCDDVDNKTSAPALFTCLGYSAPEFGAKGIAVGFTVNNGAITEYQTVTGKAVRYGVFAVLQDRLDGNEIFGEDGVASDGVISADITNHEFAAFELKIVGFTDEQKDTRLAMGAYVCVTGGEAIEYSYMQDDTKGETVNGYTFVSYNDVVEKPSTNE